MVQYAFLYFFPSCVCWYLSSFRFIYAFRSPCAISQHPTTNPQPKPFVALFILFVFSSRRPCRGMPMHAPVCIYLRLRLGIYVCLLLLGTDVLQLPASSFFTSSCIDVFAVGSFCGCLLVLASLRLPVLLCFCVRAHLCLIALVFVVHACASLCLRLAYVVFVCVGSYACNFLSIIWRSCRPRRSVIRSVDTACAGWWTACRWIRT